MTHDAASRSVLLDFLEQYLGDATAGEPRPLEDYLARFPGFEELIREEYARQDAAQSADDAAPILRVPDEAGVVQDAELMDRLRARFATPVRYRRGDEIGRGGASRVYLARDVELDRELAMKVHQGTRPSALRRFVREARVLGRLDHPGVVPIHELGLDAQGRVYFTMRLVRGQSLKQRFDDLAARPDAGLRRGALEAVLRVCDTMAYAHSQGVIHRDLKPSNVMLGGFGEVYVVDWGLARLVARGGEEDTGDEHGDIELDTPLETLAGDVLGTPAYMSPEQARGAQSEIGPRSDVYSVGAILYHLLSGHAPFQDGESTPKSREMLARVLAGPPPKLARLIPDAPAELISICERSMARDVERRYSSCSEMAVDLRAYLDGRVVRAHKTGLVRRARKWVARNRALSAAIAGALVLGSGALLTWKEARAKETSLSLLADLRGPLELLDEFPTLWPAIPDNKIALTQWIARAKALQQRADSYQDQLDEIRAKGARVEDSAWVKGDFAARRAERIAVAEAAQLATKRMLVAAEKGDLPGASVEQLRVNLASLDRNIDAMRALPMQRTSWNFRDPQEQLLHDRLNQFLAEIDYVVGREALRDRVILAQAASSLADEVDAGSSPELDERWRDAQRAIRSAPVYDSLALPRQRGLIPLGPDPHSGLWEFAHVQSGSVPIRNPDGNLSFESDAAIVLVLIPGGDFYVGSQRIDPASPNYDPVSERLEGPTINGPIDPFFMSKYEITVEQWSRLSGAPRPVSSPQARLPQDAVDGLWSVRVLAAYGLDLPTSIEWEYSARAGTDTPWWCGSDSASLEGAGNIADQSWQKAANRGDTDICGPVGFDDGHIAVAPVGRFRANAFGLHDTIGNVAEWCRDQTRPYMFSTLGSGTELLRDSNGLQIVRGGWNEEGAFGARSAARLYLRPTTAAYWLGFRASRRIAR